MKNNKFDSFFYSNFSKNDEKFQLEGEESKHLLVFRPQPGQILQISNGCGLLAQATIRNINKQNIELELIPESIQEFPPPSTTLVIGYLKGKDLEEVVEICGQYSLKAIQPVFTEHSQHFSKTNFARHLKRLQQKSRVCTKQAKKAWETLILAPMSLEEYLANAEGPNCILDWGSLKAPITIPKSLFCGPEGGFSKDEIKKISDMEQTSVLSLGETRIRAKHAPAFALGALAQIR